MNLLGGSGKQTKSSINANVISWKVINESDDDDDDFVSEDSDEHASKKIDFPVLFFCPTIARSFY